MNATLLHSTLESGKVIRYHAVPTVKSQLLAHHQWNVAILVMYLTNCDCHANLLMEALMHDTDEYITGDIPFTVKRDNPELKKMVALLALKARREDTIHDEFATTAEEKAILKVCDTLDGFIWCALHEDKRGPVEDRWHEAYLVARTKFREMLTLAQWEKADELFTRYGGILSDAE